MYNEKVKYTRNDYREYKYHYLGARGRRVKRGEVIPISEPQVYTGTVSAISLDSAEYKVIALAKAQLGTSVCVRDMRITEI